MAGINVDYNLHITGGEDVKKLKEEIEQLKADLAAAEDNADSLNDQLRELGNNRTKTALEGIQAALKGISSAQADLSKGSKEYNKATVTLSKNIAKQMEDTVKKVQKSADILDVSRRARLVEVRTAETAAELARKSLSPRQRERIGNLNRRLEHGELSTLEYGGLLSKTSSTAYKLFTNLLSKNTLTTEGRKARKDDLEHARKKLETQAKNEELARDGEQRRQHADEMHLANLTEEIKRGERITQEVEKQLKIQTREYDKQEKAKTSKRETDAEAAAKRKETAEINRQKAQSKLDEYNASAEAKELRRQQKLEENERARITLYQQLGQIMTGAYDGTEKSTQKAELASKRLLETMRHIQEFAATEGFTGTVGLESTDVLRAQQYYNSIMNVAVEWKRANSQEGKAADLLGRMLVDTDKFRGGINRVHTALGQVASTISSITGVAKQFRQTLLRITQPVMQMLSQFTSQAFKNSLEALKNIELSEIGFGNFFGEFEVPGIMSNIKQNALLSPLSAAQLASYVNQIAPLSNGNSTLATNAAMGVAKMIQYSGGEVTTEMEYVIRNLRDVISKGKATSIDIRQFNRAMPALKKVLQEMGLEDFLKDGELSISKETAPQLLEAFQKINESEDVGSIFDKTSVTISGLIERMQEQIELLVIDIADFAGATDWIKNTLHDILEDGNGWITDIKTFLSFVGNNIMRWVKSRDWEYFAKSLKEIFDIFRQAVTSGVAAVKEALGGSDTAQTIRDIAKALSEFIKGIANSYAWLINLIKGLSNSGILGSGVLQAGMGIMGFLSGNAGTLITGIARGTGNFMGVINQITTSLINSMKVWQTKLLETATTVSGFDEAILLASQASTDLAADFAIMQQMLSGSITAGEAKQAMEEIEIASKQRLVAAQEANIASENAETLANKAAAESETAKVGTNAAGSGLAGGLFGASAIGGTKLGSILGTLGKGFVGALLAGTLGNLIGSGIGNAVSNGNKYVSSGISSGVGNVAGGAAAGAAIGSIIPGLGTGIGAIVGAVGGLVKQVFDIKGIIEDKRKDDLEALEAQINSGEYTRQLLNKTIQGQRVTDGDFDRVNSLTVKLMHQFNETFPNGTADALLEFLSEMAYNGATLNDVIAASNKTREQNANDLWKAIENETIDEDTGEFLANEIAATLYDAGYDNSDITAMVLEKAVQAGLDDSKILDIMTKWSSVQTTGGEDLSREYLLGLKNGSEVDQEKFNSIYVPQLTTLYQKVMANLLKDLPEDVMSEEEKVDLSKKMAETWVSMITDSLDTADKEGIFSLTRLFQVAGVNANNSPFNLGITDKDVSNLNDYKIKLYGINNNWDTWSRKLYVFGEGISRYSDLLTSRIAVFGQKVQATAESLNIFQELFNKIFNPSSWSFGGNGTGNGGGGGGRANGGLVYKASGGDIRGVDTVPAMLQTGEYVVRRSAVNKIGLSAMNALNTGDLGYFARAIGRQNIYGDYSNARTWNNTNNDNRKSVRNTIKVYNNSKGARLNRYYSLANRLA